MDLNTISTYRRAASRADLALAPGEKILGGGTWLYSEPQVETTGLVDLTSMGWPAFEFPTLEDGGGLTVAATCTIAELVALPRRAEWPAQILFEQCANALLASFKIWNTATVGGNICQSFSAAGIVSLCSALDATALVWRPDGSDYEVAVADLMAGNAANHLLPGEVLRSVHIPEHALRARTGYRKIALAELGRSGAVLTGRVDKDGSTVFSISAATLTPVVLRYPALPDASQLASDAGAAEGYYSDPLGSADWRLGVTRVLLEEIRDELEGAS